MKLLVLLCLLALLAPAAAARQASDPDRRLDELLGDYDVLARRWSSPDAEPVELAGGALWERSHDGKQVHESFWLAVDGKRLAGDAYVAWRPQVHRYELTQIDGFSPSTFWLVGDWDASRQRLALHDLVETRPPGWPELRWEYRFLDDGGFVKEMLLADGAGGYWLASDYRYVPRGSHAPRTTQLDGTVRVPFEEGFQWAVVEVTLNDRGPFRMIVDTGASVTVLDQDLADELGLASEGTTRIGDPTNPTANEVGLVTLDSVRLADASFEGVEAVSWTPGGLVRGSGVRGVLGRPLFEECLLTFDYPGRALELARGELPPVDGREVFAVSRGDIATVPIDVAGVRYDAHLDTGNSSSLILPGAWRDAVPLVEGSARQGYGRRANGPVEFTTATLDGDVRLGGLTFERPEVRFDPGLPDANVGYALLQHFRVTLDQRTGRLRLEAQAGTAAPGPQGATGGPVAVRAPGAGSRRSLGVALAQRSDGPTSVDFVAPGSAAEAAGLQKGDAVLSIDGEPMSQERLLAALAGEDEIRFTVERDGEELELVAFPVEGS